MENKLLAKNALFNMLYKLLNVIIPLIAYMYVARALKPEGFGVAAAAQNNVTYFLILATLGIPAYGIREIARNRNDVKELERVFSELFFLNGILTTFAVVTLIAALLLFSTFRDKGMLYLIYGCAVILNFFNVEWVYQGLEKYGYIAVRSIIIKLISLGLIVLFVHDLNDVYIYATISILDIAINYFVNIIFLKGIVRFRWNTIHPLRHIKSLSYLALCTISTELYARIDVTMLDLMQNSTQVGLYSYAHRVVNIAITFIAAITAVFLPRLNYYYEIDKLKFDQLVRFGMNLMIAVSIPASVGVFFISKPIILILFGDKFEMASVILRILVLMIPLKCIGDIVCYQVMMSARQEKVLLKAYFIILAVNLINNYILIPICGAKGAAAASVISEILAILFVVRVSKRIVDFKPDKRNLACTMGISFLIAGEMTFLLIINLPHIFVVIIGLLFAGIIFIIINIMAKNNIIMECLIVCKKRIIVSVK